MPPDVEARLRGSLETRGHDVRADPAMWETVQARLRRRAFVRWSAVGLTAAAVLAVTALVLPGVRDGTRIDLSPAHPGPARGVPALVSTDGRTIVATDAAGEVLAEIDPPSLAADPLPVTRLAVRPGSTPDDFSVVYTRADAACADVEVHWVTVAGEETASGTLGGAEGSCITDPVWSPDGSVVGWVRHGPSADASDWEHPEPPPVTAADDRYELHVRGWHGGNPQPREPMADNQWAPLDLGPLEDGQPPVRALRATDWVWTDTPGLEMDGRVGPGGVLRLSASHDGGTVRTTILGPVRQHPEPGHSLDMETAEIEPPILLDDASPLVTVGGHQADGAPAEPVYSLALLPTDDVGLHRATGDDVRTLPLPPDVLDAEQAGDAWLAARGDTVVFGAGGDAWRVSLQGDRWSELEALPGIVSGDLMAPPAAVPTPSPSSPLPTGLSVVATDGEAITVDGPDGHIMAARAVEGDVTDFTVHPDSTAEHLTVVWREGTGCDATLHHVTVIDGDEAASGTLPADCPGRPAFAPDGSHLAWMADAGDGGATSGEFTLETLGWDDGPADSTATFSLSANPAELMILTVLDWVWTEDATTGQLLLAGTDGHGTVSALTVPIEAQGDGAVALPADATAEQVTPFVFDAGQDRFALLQAHGHRSDPAAVGPEYTLEERTRADEGRDLAVVRGDGGDAAGEDLVLPEGLLRVNETGEVDDVWMTARGDEVLLGDGAGRAWHLPWTGDGWGELGELGGEVRYAVPLPGPADDGPELGGARVAPDDREPGGDRQLVHLRRLRRVAGRHRR